MNIKTYKKTNNLPPYNDLLYHRPVLVSKNPSNLVSFLNVNSKYKTQKIKSKSDDETLTDKFLKNLCNEDLHHNYQY